jgi:hypothetical protein
MHCVPRGSQQCQSYRNRWIRSQEAGEFPRAWTPKKERMTKGNQKRRGIRRQTFSIRLSVLVAAVMGRKETSVVDAEVASGNCVWDSKCSQWTGLTRRRCMNRDVAVQVFQGSRNPLFSFFLLCVVRRWVLFCARVLLERYSIFSFSSSPSPIVPWSFRLIRSERAQEATPGDGRRNFGCPISRLDVVKRSLYPGPGSVPAGWD